MGPGGGRRAGYGVGVANTRRAAWGLGAAGYGLGYANGVAAWGVGSAMYDWGYSGYSNPYNSGGGGDNSGGGGSQQGDQSQQGSGYDYSQPISTTAPPPESSATDQATTNFDQARGAFKGGDYASALTLVNQALTQMPNDATLHEFLALVLFAQGNYDQAAVPLYAVLSVGPGWDWTTLSGMYPDVETYTTQVRALESALEANPDSAPPHFVLAYHYITQGHDEAAVVQLKDVVELKPDDKLSAQLLAQYQSPGDTSPPAAPAASASTVPAGKLPGTWTASPAANSTITLAIQDDDSFTWTVADAGKPPATIAGDSALANGVLTLTGKGARTAPSSATWPGRMPTTSPSTSSAARRATRD